jgi:hypothetical protein
MEDPNHTYRTLHFLVKHGNLLAAAIGIGVLLLGPVIWLVNGSSWAVPICIAASAFLYVILRSYVELVRVIVDMLLPK